MTEPEQEPGTRRWTTLAVFAVILALPLALVVGGASMLYQRQVGAHAQATITGCETSHGYKSYSQECTGTWTVDGRPAVGTVQGADPGDVGDTIDVTLTDDGAASTSLVLPILLIALGLPFLALVLWPRLRRRERRLS